jgi:hypothetical protein
MFSTNFHTKTIPSRWTGLLTYLLFVLFIVSCNPVTSGREIDKSKLYLEQTLAGLEPEIFAPGIISLEGRHEECPVFSPDSTEFYFTVWEQPEPEVFHTILYTTLQNGKWTKPEVAPFSQAYSNHCPTFSPDGQTLFFVSTRPPEPGAPPSDDTNLWLVTRTEEGWSEPKIFPAPVNSEAGEYRPSVAADGTLYFLSHRASGRGQADLYRALLTDGGSWIVENLGGPINTKYEDGAVSIAPDGSYLIMVAFYADQTPPFNGDLYLSFSTQDDTWTTPTRIDWPGLNTSANEYQPMLSPDGKYLFFARSSGYPSGDIYWVDMRALEKFLAPPATADVEEVQVYLDQFSPRTDEPDFISPQTGHPLLLMRIITFGWLNGLRQVGRNQNSWPNPSTQPPRSGTPQRRMMVPCTLLRNVMMAREGLIFTFQSQAMANIQRLRISGIQSTQFMKILMPILILKKSL